MQQNQQLLNEILEEYIKNELYTKRTDLCEILENAGSDKSTWHNYSTFYKHIFEKMNYHEKEINFFEMGLGSKNIEITSNMRVYSDTIPAGSLRAFGEYFPKSKLYGADIDGTIAFQTDKIKTYQCDQTSPSDISRLWNNFDFDFDVILDDGLHQAHANIIFNINSFHKLKKGGLYIIEDVGPRSVDALLEYVECVYKDCAKIYFRIPINFEWHKILKDRQDVPSDNVLLIIMK
jgi:hypothetical protein